VSNPPYIAYGDARVDEGAMHDPKMALYADMDGFAAYESIAKNARGWIKRGGKIYLEIGIGMGSHVREIFEGSGWKFVRSEFDLAQSERVLVFSK
jgi:release factor glutamine methyltransferase